MEGQQAVAMKLEIKAKTVNDAIDEALEKLGVSIDEIEYKVLQESAKGFLGFGSRDAIVSVWVKGEETKSEEKDSKKASAYSETKAAAAPSKKESAKKEPTKKEPAKKEPTKKEPSVEEVPKQTSVKAEPEKVADKATVYEFNSEDKTFSEVKEKKVVDPTDKAVAFLNEVFEAMHIRVDIDANFTDNKQLNINLSGSEMGVVIGKRGQTLDSLQYILNLVVNRGDAAYVSVNLNTEHYREKRKETLEKLAFNLAKKAKHLKKNVVLEPMNPYERRIIHYTLQNDRYVTTYSEGTEPYRYVVIAPKPAYLHKSQE